MKNFIQNSDLIEIAEKSHKIYNNLIKEINSRKIKLFSIPAHKRIFLFIFTRAYKSFSALELLFSHGYGQDASALVRILLENLITVKYILLESNDSDILAKRFVDYKWIILKRTIQEEEKNIKDLNPQDQKDFEKKKTLILENVSKFKTDYNIKSDKALLTWSGKTIRDMAKATDTTLLKEYDTTFRTSSKFFHPSILGDREYIIHSTEYLTFSPKPSSIGIELNYLKAIFYINLFFKTLNDLYTCNNTKHIDQLLKKLISLELNIHTHNNKHTDTKQKETKPYNLKEVIIEFN